MAFPPLKNTPGAGPEEYSICFTEIQYKFLCDFLQYRQAALTPLWVTAIISGMPDGERTAENLELLAAARLAELPDRSAPLRGGQSVAVLGKKVLLQILAVSEAQRLGITVGQREISETAAVFRDAFGLTDDGEFQSWLVQESLTQQRFREVMHRFAIVAKIETYYAAEIRREVPDMLRIDAARERAKSSG
jgi:hypothetical protein